MPRLQAEKQLERFGAALRMNPNPVALGGRHSSPQGYVGTPKKAENLEEQGRVVTGSDRDQPSSASRPEPIA